MDLSSKTFLDYNDEDYPVSLDVIPGQDFYSTSPDYSESTAKNTHSLSPDIQSFYPTNDQLPIESWAYEDNFLLQNLEESQTDHMSENNQTNGKAARKSNRVTKRTIAKERTKTKQEVASILKSSNNNSPPQDLDDPNLDEKTKKKMKQMMRNRISAQNSRDRKKMYAQQLEEANAKLTEENFQLRKEKDNLLSEISKLQHSESHLIQENQTLKNNMCSSCRQASNQGFTLNQADTEQNLIDYGNSSGGFSNLASPILARFPSGKGIFTFLTFAAVVSCVMVLNMPQNKEIVLQAPVIPEFKGNARVLEMNKTSNSIQLQESRSNVPMINPYIIQNMGPLKKYFNQNYELLFKDHLQIIPILNQQWDEEIVRPIEDSKPQNALVQYNDPKVSHFRRKIPTVITQNLPVLEQMPEGQTQTSTLFCPTAFEFSDNAKTIGFPNNHIKDRNLDIEKADYLQLFVPRNRIANIDMRNGTDMYESLVPSEADDNSMLEIWCKVFLVRELNASL